MRRAAALVLVAVLAGLTVTACDPDPATGSCAHAASAKATNLTDFYGTTHSMAETFVWVKWIAFNSCNQGPDLWVDWSWSCESWDYPWSGNTRSLEGGCFQYVTDEGGGRYGTTAFNSGTYESHDGHTDVYGLRARVHVAADGWVYWYCGRTDNLAGGSVTGWVDCQFHLDY